MDFDTVLDHAVRRCKTETALARRLGINKNAIRQWRIGLALPRVTAEWPLAKLAGVTVDVCQQAIREEMIRRWDQRRDRARRKF
jgi:transcriptional regulator with XRE-family HTH domain